MSHEARGIARLVCLLIPFLILIAIGVVWRLSNSVLPPSNNGIKSISSPTRGPATTQATTVSVAAPPPSQLFDVVRIHYPDFPATQPLPFPLDLRESARLIIPDPLYLDAIGQIWITRPDAEPVATVLKQASSRDTHVTRERVVFVHRFPDQKGVWQPMLVILRPDDAYEVVSAAGRQELGRDYAYRWDRAWSWNDAIVVPTDRGVSILRPDRRPMELHHDLVPPDQFQPGKFSDVQTLLDWRGLIAWMPWEADKLGSRGAARFVNDRWVPLDPAAGWPQRLLHLVPLLDGSVLQLVVNDDKTVDVAMAALDPAEIDRKQVEALVEQLSDPDAVRRNAAFLELTRWGSGVWPLLEQLEPDQPPEAKVRLGQLLAAKTQPTLGGMVLQRGPADVVARGEAGALVLHSEAGVSIPCEEDEPLTLAPAWIAILPGRTIELMPEGLVAELQPQGTALSIIRGEFIVTSPVDGPHWWLSNHLSPPLLKPGEGQFKLLVGQDCRGRWIFRKQRDGGPSLVIDPTLPDPTPHLPVWQILVEQGSVGWTQDNWPAIKRGGAWALRESDWRPIDERKEKMLTVADQQTQPGRPASSPATSPATGESAPPILIEADGARWYDGLQALVRVAPDGRRIEWPLPAQAVGSGEVHLLRAGEDRLFLFNQPGRVCRIKPTPDAAEPFKLEATFTRKIPNVDRADRIWLDPAGRIVVAYDGDKLAILFPAGRIPQPIAQKMTARDLQDAEE